METLTAPSPCGFHEIPCSPCEMSPGRTASFPWSSAVICRLGSCGEGGTGGTRRESDADRWFLESAYPLLLLCGSELAGSHDLDNSLCRGRMLGDQRSLASGCLNSGTSVRSSQPTVRDAMMRPP